MLRFYVSEKQRHNDELLYEWLLQEAKLLGIPGGSAVRVIAGFGRHGRLHEETFFELGGELTIQIEFVLSGEQADQLLEKLGSQQLNLFYLRHAVTTGVI